MDLKAFVHPFRQYLLIFHLSDPPKDIKTTEAVERATIASAYRLGQTKQISVVRFIFKDTIMDEEFVQKILSDDKKMKRRLVEINNREK